MKILLPFLLLFATTLTSDDIATGEWTITGEVEGVSVNEVCALAQTDAKVTGSCAGMGKKWDTTGAVEGKKVTFSHAGEYNGDPLTLTYTGILGDDGTLKGSIDVDPMNVSGVFSAKKSVAKAAAPAPAE
jgi:hypothetical protein